MHTRTRSWNIPLGIGLFGAAVLVGGAILAIPETRKAPSHVDVSDPIKSKPFPSFPEETHPTIPGSQLSDEAATSLDAAAPRGSVRAPLPAPTGIGGGRPERAEEPPEPDEIEPPEGRRGAPSPAPVPVPTPAPATTAQPITTNGAAGDAGAAAPPSQPIADGGPSAVSDAQILPPDGGIWGVQVGDATVGVDPNAPYMYPTFGGPGVAGTAGTVVGPGGVTAPASGSTGGSSGGMTTTQQTITAPLLLPMSDAPERFWNDVGPYMKSGDVVVANVTSESSPLIPFAERVHTDAPLVTYVVAFANTAQLESTLAKGLPAALTVVGLSSSAGLSDASLASTATKVHDNGRRLFLTLKYPTDGPSLAGVSKSVDMVELVVTGANSNEITTNAKTAATALGPKIQLYIRLPASLTSPTNAANATSVINAALPNAGVALPSSAAASISSYRSR